MSKYEEMVKAADEGRMNWIRRHESTTQFIYQLLFRFRKACDMPEERLRILPWDNKAERFDTDAAPLTTVLSSTRYDLENDTWQAGVVVYFNPDNHFPRLYATFVLFVTENDYRFTVKIGEPGKPQPIDLHVQSQTQQFFDTLTKVIEEAMKEPTKQHRIVIHGFATPVTAEAEPVAPEHEAPLA
jgi:hypothetical protein